MALLWGEHCSDRGNPPGALPGVLLPILPSAERVMGCLVSITVTCTFLKSNRSLWVGVLLSCGTGYYQTHLKASLCPVLWA